MSPALPSASPNSRRPSIVGFRPSIENDAADFVDSWPKRAVCVGVLMAENGFRNDLAGFELHIFEGVDRGSDDDPLGT